MANETPEERLKRIRASVIAGATTVQPKAPKPTGFLAKTLDVLMRPTFGVAGAAKAAVSGEDITEEFWKGIRGEDKETFSDVLGAAGWNPTTTTGKIARGVLGFTGDVIFDPLTYLGIGGLTKAGRLAKAGKAAKGAKKAIKLEPTLVRQATAGQRALVTFAGHKVLKAGSVFKGLSKMGSALEKFDTVQSLGKAFNIKWIKPLQVTDDEWANILKAKERARLVYNSARSEAISGGKQLAKEVNALLKKGVDKTDVSDVLRKLADSSVKISDDLIDPYNKLKALKGLSAEALQKADRALLEGFDISHVLTNELRDSLPKVDGGFSILKNELPREFHRKYLKFGNDVINSKTGEVWRNGNVVQVLRKADLDSFMMSNTRKVADVPTINKALGKEFFSENLGVIYGGMTDRTGRINAGLTFADNIKKLGKVSSEAPHDWVESKLSMLKGMKFSPEVAKHLDEVWKRYNAPEEIGKFMGAYSKALNFWKGTATFLNIPFHARNFVSNIWQNSLAGISPVNKAYVQAANIQRKLILGSKLTLKESKLWDEYATEALSMGVFAADIPEEIISSIATKSMLKKAARSPFAIGRAIGEKVEDGAKLAHFIAKRNDGFTAQAAAESVRKFLFDYTDLSETERKIFKKLFPFYTWTRKNLPLQVEMLLTSPERVARLGKVKAAAEAQFDKEKKPSEELLPEWMRENLPVYLGGDKKIARFGTLAGFVPTADIVKVLKPGETLLSSLSPFIKGFGELPGNHHFFFNNKIKEYEGQRKELLNLHLPPGIDYLIRQIRPINEANKFIKKSYQPRTKEYARDIKKAFVEYATGFKTYEQDVAYLKKIKKNGRWTPTGIEAMIKRDLTRAKRKGFTKEAARLKNLLNEVQAANRAF